MSELKIHQPKEPKEHRLAREFVHLCELFQQMGEQLKILSTMLTPLIEKEQDESPDDKA